jgi:hypothetical protein
MKVVMCFLRLVGAVSFRRPSSGFFLRFLVMVYCIPVLVEVFRGQLIGSKEYSALLDTFHSISGK